MDDVKIVLNKLQLATYVTYVSICDIIRHYPFNLCNGDDRPVTGQLEAAALDRQQGQAWCCHTAGGSTCQAL